MNRLKIHLLGPFRVMLDGAPRTHFESKTTRALLAYLAVAPRVHQRRDLSNLLWEGQTGLANLRTTLTRLRRALGTQQTKSILLATRHTLQLTPEYPIWVDALEVERLLAAVEAHAHMQLHHCPRCIDLLTQISELFAGEFLADVYVENQNFEEWHSFQQEKYHRLLMQVLETLTEHHQQQGNYYAAESSARRQLALEPWHETAHRQLMHALHASGHRSAALVQYETCRHILATKLSAEPTPETIMLYEQVQSGKLTGIIGEPRNPYKGLRAFEEWDAPDFFGREGLIKKLLARLTPSPESGCGGRFLAIVGPSGSGKSSLVKAGLIPALRRGTLPGSEKWRIVQMLPGTHPLDDLAAALWQDAETDLSGKKVVSQHDLAVQLRCDERGLLQAVETVLPTQQTAELLLVIDQFEELFTLVEDEIERAHFLQSLQIAVTDPNSHLRVIIMLRADFYGRPMQYADFGNLLCRHDEPVLPLLPDELAQAIIGPSARVGVELEPGLAAVIAGDFSVQTGALSLLQYALTELFKRRQDGGRHYGGILTQAAYQTTGGVSGALNRRAEELYQELNEADQEVTRQVFLRLVTLGEGVEDTRRRALRSELESLSTSNPQYFGKLSISSSGIENGDWGLEIGRILDVFGAARLLTFDYSLLTGEPTVEVAHEALLQAWGRLRVWLDEYREAIRRQRRLSTAAAEWARTGRGTAFLSNGGRLDQYMALNGAAELALTFLEADFLQASLDGREKRRVAEAVRQAREAALEKRAKNQLLWLTAFAFRQRQIAQREAAVSRSLNLVTSAQLALKEKDTDLALALALEANRISDPPPQVQLMLADAAYAPGTHRLFCGHAGPVRDVATTPDGRLVLSASVDQTLILWDLASGERLRHLKGHTGPINGVAISPDGKTALSGASDKNLILWCLDTGEIIRRFGNHHFDGHASAVQKVVIHPDGKNALSGASDNSLILWDMDTGKPLRRLEGHTDAVLSLAISPDGKTALSGSADRSVIYWDLSSGEIIYHFVGHTDALEAYLTGQGHVDSVWGVAFSLDGGKGISVAQDYRIIVWDLAAGEQISLSEPIKIGLTSLALSPDGRTVLSGQLDGQIAFFDPATGESPRQLKGHTGRIHALTFTPDNRRALSGADDGTLRLWNLHSGVEMRQLYDERIGCSVAISPDGQIGLMGLFDCTVALWDYESGEILRYLHGHSEYVLAGAYFTPDGKRVVSGSGNMLGVSEDNTVRVWDVATGEEIRRFEGHTDKLWNVAVGPNGRYVASSSHDGTLRLWDIQTGAGQVLYDAFPQAMRSAAFSPDGASILFSLAKGQSETPDYRLCLIDISSITLASTGSDVQTERKIRHFEGYQETVGNVAFSPDGRLALSGSNDASLILWDVATGRPVHWLIGHTTSVLSVAFGPDGKLAASCDISGEVLLWDVAAGTLLRRYTGHDEYAIEVVFTPNGKTLLSVASDNTVREWLVDASQERLLDWIAVNRYVPELTHEH